MILTKTNPLLTVLRSVRPLSVFSLTLKCAETSDTGPLSTNRNNRSRAQAQGYFSAQVKQHCPYYHRVADMNAKPKKKRKIPSEIETDQKVISQANDESAWGKPVQVKRTKPASLSIPAELAARAAFLARLHREKGPEAWLTRIIRKRVELEEVAFIEAKCDLAGNDYPRTPV